jgi:hypothetical protein
MGVKQKPDFALVIIGLVVFVKSNPPLVSDGVTWNSNDKTFKFTTYAVDGR